ncbi:hypothetical protein AB1N83_013914 [Pleurotus pulmonarius]
MNRSPIIETMGARNMSPSSRFLFTKPLVGFAAMVAGRKRSVYQSYGHDDDSGIDGLRRRGQIPNTNQSQSTPTPSLLHKQRLGKFLCAKFSFSSDDMTDLSSFYVSPAENDFSITKPNASTYLHFAGGSDPKESGWVRSRPAQRRPRYHSARVRGT